MSTQVIPDVWRVVVVEGGHRVHVHVLIRHRISTFPRLDIPTFIRRKMALENCLWQNLERRQPLLRTRATRLPVSPFFYFCLSLLFFGVSSRLALFQSTALLTLQALQVGWNAFPLWTAVVIITIEKTCPPPSQMRRTNKGNGCFRRTTWDYRGSRILCLSARKKKNFFFPRPLHFFFQMRFFSFLDVLCFNVQVGKPRGGSRGKKKKESWVQIWLVGELSRRLKRRLGNCLWRRTSNTLFVVCFFVYFCSSAGYSAFVPFAHWWYLDLTSDAAFADSLPFEIWSYTNDRGRKLAGLYLLKVFRVSLSISFLSFFKYIYQEATLY